MSDGCDRLWRYGVRPRAGAVAAALVTVVLAGCGAPENEPSGAEDTPGEAAPTPTPESSYGGVVPAAQAPVPEGYSATNVQGVRINVPEGWRTGNESGGLCVRPPERQGCAYGAFLVLPRASETQPKKWPSKHFDKDKGWAAEPKLCRSADTFDTGEVKVEEASLETKDFTTHADGRVSHHSVWTVDCENDESFQVRLWYLPESDVAAYVWSVDSRHDATYRAIAESMDVTEYKESRN